MLQTDFREELTNNNSKKLKYHQLLCATIPCLNDRPEVEDMIVQISCYDSNGRPIMEYNNCMIELKYLISYVHKKRHPKIIITLLP